MSDWHDYIVEIDEGPGITSIGNLQDESIDLEIFEGARGPAGNPGLVLLEVNEPLPSPPLDGVLYLRLLS